MRIAFYAPFKPLDHPNPSGDLIIATGLVDYLRKRGNAIHVASRIRSRWIYWKPWNLVRILLDRTKITREFSRKKVDLWLTYHSYYKAPDMIGQVVAKKLHIPYVIFQGIYSTKVRRRWQTRPGYDLNTRALKAADLVMTNRHGDLVNLQRLLPNERISYLAPGIHPSQFTANMALRKKMRAKWQADNVPVILSAAMFRADVKTEGLIWVIESSARLIQKGHDLLLVIAGDGKERKKLTRLAEELLGNNVLFAGKIPREKMSEFYSGGDLFVFPGINESLGMVFLEAQSCGLPIVAFDTAGVPEVTNNRETALLTAPYDKEQFDLAVATLLGDKDKRIQMGAAAARYIRQHHDLAQNYHQLELLLEDVVSLHKARESSCQ